MIAIIQFPHEKATQGFQRKPQLELKLRLPNLVLVPRLNVPGPVSLIIIISISYTHVHLHIRNHPHHHRCPFKTTICAFVLAPSLSFPFLRLLHCKCLPLARLIYIDLPNQLHTPRPRDHHGSRNCSSCKGRRPCPPAQERGAAQV